MARRGKTKIGGGSQEQSRTMMAAKESGFDRQQAAHRDLMAQRESGKRYTTELARQVGSDFTEQQRYTEQQEFREKQATGEQALGQQRIDLAAEQSGVQRSGDAPTAPLLDDRKQQLQAEMQQGSGMDEAAQAQAATPPPGALPPEQQQNLQDQVTKGAALAGRSFVPTEEGAAAQRQGAAFKAAEVTSKLKNADANFMNAQANYARALNVGGEAGQKQREASAKVMLKKMDESRELITNLQLGKARPMDVAAAYADGNSNMQEILDRQGMDPGDGPRVIQFLRGRIGQQGLRYMATTGMQAPGLEPDNPVMRRYNQRFNEVAGAFRTLQQNQQLGAIPSQAPAFEQAAGGQQLGALSRAWQGIKNYDDRNSFLTQVTAQTMLEAEAIRSAQRMDPIASGRREREQSLMAENQQLRQQVQQFSQLLGAGGGGGPSQQQQQAVGAVQQSRAAGGDPSAALRAGQAADPTAQRDKPASSGSSLTEGVGGGIL